MKERYQLRQAAGAYWLLDMEQGEQYKKPFMLNECGAYIYRAYISGMSEDEIMQAFATKIPNTTKIIISQRISSVQDADRIIVLDNGMVSGFDTHENLLKNNTIYKEIYDVQMSGGGDFDEKMN